MTRMFMACMLLAALVATASALKAEVAASPARAAEAKSPTVSGITEHASAALSSSTGERKLLTKQDSLPASEVDSKVKFAPTGAIAGASVGSQEKRAIAQQVASAGEGNRKLLKTKPMGATRDAGISQVAVTDVKSGAALADKADRVDARGERKLLAIRARGAVTDVKNGAALADKADRVDARGERKLLAISARAGARLNEAAVFTPSALVDSPKAAVASQSRVAAAGNNVDNRKLLAKGYAPVVEKYLPSNSDAAQANP